MVNQSVKILVVEDEFIVKSAIIRILKKMGHNVIGDASNGKDGIEKAMELDPDVILMDISMEVMDGIEAAGIIQKKRPTPIVFLTSHESTQQLEDAIKAGASYYLTKPPKSSDLNRALLVALARHNDLKVLEGVNKELEIKTAALKQALDELKIMKGIIPICSNCKKIRDDKGYWNILETFIEKHSDALFSHSVCPKCMKELYGDESWFDDLEEE
jgi:CheY-like chemotaxis protein